MQRNHLVYACDASYVCRKPLLSLWFSANIYSHVEPSVAANVGSVIKRVLREGACHEWSCIAHIYTQGFSRFTCRVCLFPDGAV